MQSIRNFPILNSEFTPLAATAVTARVKLPNDAADIMFYNPNASIIYVRTGDDAVAATATAMPILPGEKGIYNRGGTPAQATHLAFISPAGALTLHYAMGEGA